MLACIDWQKRWPKRVKFRALQCNRLQNSSSAFVNIGSSGFSLRSYDLGRFPKHLLSTLVSINVLHPFQHIWCSGFGRKSMGLDFPCLSTKYILKKVTHFTADGQMGGSMDEWMSRLIDRLHWSPRGSSGNETEDWIIICIFNKKKKCKKNPNRTNKHLRLSRTYKRQTESSTSYLSQHESSVVSVEQPVTLHLIHAKQKKDAS